MKNPSERRCGYARYRSLAASVDLWRTVSRRVAERLGADGSIVSLRSILDAFQEPGFRVYQSALAYCNVRFARAIIIGCGYRVADSEDDWAVLRRMSCSVRSLCKRWGLEYAAAINIRDAMRRRYPSYSLLDLSCYLCLADI